MKHGDAMKDEGSGDRRDVRLSHLRHLLDVITGVERLLTRWRC